METLYSFEADVPAGQAVLASRFAPPFSPNSAPGIDPDCLLAIIDAAADRALLVSCTNVTRDLNLEPSTRDLLILLSFAYLRGVYHSSDVVQLLDSDNTLLPIRQRLGLRPEHVRHFRREHRVTIVACLSDCIAQIEERRRAPYSSWRHPNSPFPSPHTFEAFHPAREAALELFDRAVSLDSMALDE